MSTSSDINSFNRLPERFICEQVRSTWETFNKNINDPKSWERLVPAIGALALYVLLAPTTAPIGMLISVIVFTPVTVLNILLVATKIASQINVGPSGTYREHLQQNPLYVTLIGPIWEEGFFRGLMQPLAARAILVIAPATAALFLGTGLSVAMTISVVATAAIFGFVHYLNDHNHSDIQGVLATISGISLGLIAGHLGLIAAIAAHTTHNILCTMQVNYGPEPGSFRPTRYVT